MPFLSGMGRRKNTGRRKKTKEYEEDEEDEEDDSRSWSKEDKQKFEEIVSKNPILWHSKYTYQKTIKSEEYVKVAKAMNKSG